MHERGISLILLTQVWLFTLYPRKVSTDPIMGAISAARPGSKLDQAGVSVWNIESRLCVGRVIAAVVSDDSRERALARQGKIVVAAEAGNFYGVVDENGERRCSARVLRFMVLQVFFPIAAWRNFRRVFLPEILFSWTLIK